MGIVGLYMGQHMATVAELEKADLAAWRWGFLVSGYK